MAQKSFDVGAGGAQTLYLRGHDQYDAVRVDIDNVDQSASTSVDITVNVDRGNDLDDYSSLTDLETEVLTETGVSSTGSYGTTKLSRSVAVEINETDGTSGNGVSGTVNLHNSSDPAMNGDAFLDY